MGLSREQAAGSGHRSSPASAYPPSSQTASLLEFISQVSTYDFPVGKKAFAKKHLKITVFVPSL